MLRGCDLEISSGQLVGLVGENGSGKSTLVRCLLGFIEPDAGNISIHGSVGYCPQDEIMNRDFRVREHLDFIRSIYEKHCPIDIEYLAQLVDRFRLSNYEDELIGTLSGGTRQKLQFISSILHQPSLLLMDEPYQGFDWEMYLAFWDIIEELSENGTAILLITHFVYDHERFDTILELRGGRLYETHSNLL